MAQAGKQNARSDGPPPVGDTLKSMRLGGKLSLDELSRRSGVSKSMLSQIERGEANPTVAILWRLSVALAVDITDFLTDSQTRTDSAISLVPAHELPTIKSQDTKCELKILSPIDMAGTIEWYQLTIGSGGVLASEPHKKGAKESLFVQAGSMLVRVGSSELSVKAGDTARYVADVAHSIANSGKVSATAILFVQYAS